MNLYFVYFLSISIILILLKMYFSYFSLNYRAQIIVSLSRFSFWIINTRNLHL